MGVQAAGETPGGLLAAEIEQQPGGGGEQDVMVGKHGLVGDVLRDHRLAEALGGNKHAVAAGGEEGEMERGGAIDPRGPRPVEEPEEVRRVGGQALPAAGEGGEEGVGMRQAWRRRSRPRRSCARCLAAVSAAKCASALMRWSRSYARAWHATSVVRSRMRT